MPSNFCVHNCDYFVDVFERHYLIHINFMQISLRKPFLITLPSDPYSWSWSCSGTTRCLQVPGMAVRAMLQNPGSLTEQSRGSGLQQGCDISATVVAQRVSASTSISSLDLVVRSRASCWGWYGLGEQVKSGHTTFFSKMKKINI